MFLALFAASAASICADRAFESQADLRACESAEAQALDLELQAAFVRAQQFARQSDQELRQSFPNVPSDWLDTLNRAQAAWIVYRDSWCEAESNKMRPATGVVALEQECLQRLTKARVEELDRMRE